MHSFGHFIANTVLLAICVLSIGIIFKKQVGIIFMKKCIWYKICVLTTSCVSAHQYLKTSGIHLEHKADDLRMRSTHRLKTILLVKVVWN